MLDCWQAAEVEGLHAAVSQCASEHESLAANTLSDLLTRRLAYGIESARAAIAASQETAEPVAYVDGDDSLRRILWEPDQAAFNLPVGTKLYAAPVAAQASEPVALRKTFEEWLGEVVADGGCTVEALLVGDTDPIRCARSAWDACIASLYSAPQPSAAAVRDEAYETAANKATGFLVGDPLAGIPLRNPMAHEIADAIRALKSAPPKPAEQPDDEINDEIDDLFDRSGWVPAEQPSASAQQAEAEAWDAALEAAAERLSQAHSWLTNVAAARLVLAMKSAPPQPAEHIEADDTCVICPGCAHQFRAIPVQVQSLMLAAGFEPPFTDAPKEPK